MTSLRNSFLFLVQRQRLHFQEAFGYFVLLFVSLCADLQGECLIIWALCIFPFSPLHFQLKAVGQQL